MWYLTWPLYTLYTVHVGNQYLVFRNYDRTIIIRHHVWENYDKNKLWELFGSYLAYLVIILILIRYLLLYQHDISMFSVTWYWPSPYILCIRHLDIRWMFSVMRYWLNPYILCIRHLVLTKPLYTVHTAPGIDQTPIYCVYGTWYWPNPYILCIRHLVLTKPLYTVYTAPGIDQTPIYCVYGTWTLGECSLWCGIDLTHIYCVYGTWTIGVCSPHIYCVFRSPISGV